mgnify:CR=1 FL=1
MDPDGYAAFLPERYRSAVFEPVHDHWDAPGVRVHLARVPRPQAPARLLILHGAGGHSGALWPLAALAAGAGFEVLAPDLPPYGRTVAADPAAVRYPDWVALVCDLVRAERAADGRPLAVLGASMGGLLGYEVAARTGLIDHVLATCLLDPTDPAARRAAMRRPGPAGPAPALARAAARVAGRVRIPIRWVVDIAAMSRNPALSRRCATDPRGGGVRVPVGFLASWLTFAHTPPERFTAAPVTLVHPALDAWTPPELSVGFVQRIPSRTQVVLLEECGHFPVEEPGLSQLVDTLARVSGELAGSAAPPAP